MIAVRKAGERGCFDHGWLKTCHTFSFAGYHDPRHMGFRSLRVMNEDHVAPGMGFGTHPHRDMEIVTYVLEGALEHKDSMGNGEVLRPSEFQRMSAGTGITHSEFNPSEAAPVHLYQIWLFPDRKGHTPSYEQKSFDKGGRAGKWQLVASPNGRDGSLTIHQDATIHLGDLAAGESLEYSFAPQRHGWLQVLRGTVELDGKALSAGDGAAISDEPGFSLSTPAGAELMLFDLN
jgi:redox-sensitive bicupin YhaK (pirin superfamily)